jgi:hypothetical protein
MKVIIISSPNARALAYEQFKSTPYGHNEFVTNDTTQDNKQSRHLLSVLVVHYEFFTLTGNQS